MVVLSSNTLSRSIFFLMGEGSGCPKIGKSCSWRHVMLSFASELLIQSSDCSVGLTALIINLMRSHTGLLKCPTRKKDGSYFIIFMLIPNSIYWQSTVGLHGKFAGDLKLPL